MLKNRSIPMARTVYPVLIASLSVALLAGCFDAQPSPEVKACMGDDDENCPEGLECMSYDATPEGCVLPDCEPTVFWFCDRDKNGNTVPDLIDLGMVPSENCYGMECETSDDGNDDEGMYTGCDPICFELTGLANAECVADTDCAFGPCVGARCCAPSCDGTTCGDDGCGGTCSCEGSAAVCNPDDNTCSCDPVVNCEGKTCGDDGCGGSCGDCADGQSCSDGACVAGCTADCAGKTCGDDGCGQSCGDCTGDQSCSGGACVDSCTADCTGKACGDDGCGGSCGDCTSDQSCTDGTCVDGCTPSCGAAVCGDDGCGGSCGDCTGDQSCESGACVDGGCTPNCGAAVCGDDGCGGSCGVCGDGESCDASGACLNASGCTTVTVTGELFKAPDAAINHVFYAQLAQIGGSGNDVLELQFYATDLGSFDLASSNFNSCLQCVRVVRDVEEAGETIFFQDSGQLEVLAGSTPTSGKVSATLTDVTLVEVTVAGDFTSTPVAGGECITLQSPLTVATP